MKSEPWNVSPLNALRRAAVETFTTSRTPTLTCRSRRLHRLHRTPGAGLPLPFIRRAPSLRFFPFPFFPPPMASPELLQRQSAGWGTMLARTERTGLMRELHQSAAGRQAEILFLHVPDPLKDHLGHVRVPRPLLLIWPGPTGLEPFGACRVLSCPNDLQAWSLAMPDAACTIGTS